MLKSFVLCTALALTLAACASQPTSPGPSTTAAVKPPPGCVAQTATRIPVKDGECAGFGNTYTRQDIDNTGQPMADKALALMDPSVRITGH
jgi:type IV pilus biogenesis protein CpaD/CtpE